MKQKRVPIEKRSKKAQREYYKMLRGSWNGLNPITRKPDDPKAYNRAKEKASSYERDAFLIMLFEGVWAKL